MLTTNKRWNLLKSMTLCASAAVMLASGAAVAGKATDRLSANSSKLDHARAALLGNAGTALRGGLCGNSILDAGEQCDDGNSVAGDGCSDTCQIEAGFECTLPVPPVTENGVTDGGFEGGTPNAAWTEFSATFGTPLCDVAGCGTGTGTGPDTGAFWAWFGGIAAAESGSVEQSVTINSDDTELTFRREAIICDSAADFMRLTIDGNTEFEMFGDDAICGVLGYETVTIDITAYADDAAHTILFESSIFATNGAGTNFFLDNVSIARGSISPPEPSVCTELPDVCSSEDFEDGLDGITLFNDGAIALDWGTTDDGVCGSVNGPAGNFAGAGVGSCIDSDAAGNGVVNAYMCLPIDASGVSDPSLGFGVNFQVFSSTGEDALEVLVGTAAPSLISIGGYTSVYLASDDVGVFGGEGVSESGVDLSALAGGAGHVCFRYSGDFDWYGQIDDVVVNGSSCGSADSDGDGVNDDVDNCINDANPLQIDSNGDNIGNVCDADIAGPAGAGADDCQVNFFDLGQIKNVFFTTDPDADLVGAGNSEPDGQVNFFDLGRMKEVFFNPPGPSAAGCDAGS
ncbi:MAG: choice-of-anchor J domain-containing protein [Pseudomonadota bacterium]